MTRLLRVSVQEYRNFKWAELDLRARQVFLIGRNGQGKTNLLEAIAFATALRSFRNADTRDLISHGAKEANVAWIWEEGTESERVIATLKPGGKELSIDGERVQRTGDYLGRFPTVVFSSQDIQLVRGGPALRRRWMDALLSVAHPEYLRALQAYTRALEAHNKLLRDGRPDAELAAFEAQMATTGEALVRFRSQSEEPLARALSEAAGAISDAGESNRFQLKANRERVSAADWLEVWRASRERDRILKSTTSGPHREDVELLVQERSAKDFASEGQQRTLVLALRLAEVDYLERHLKRSPLILADDVLGELDPARRARFWQALGSSRQIVATGTTPPAGDTGEWQIVEVNSGNLAPFSP